MRIYILYNKTWELDENVERSDRNGRRAQEDAARHVLTSQDGLRTDGERRVLMNGLTPTKSLSDCKLRKSSGMTDENRKKTHCIPNRIVYDQLTTFTYLERCYCSGSDNVEARWETHPRSHISNSKRSFVSEVWLICYRCTVDHVQRIPEIYYKQKSFLTHPPAREWKETSRWYNYPVIFIDALLFGKIKLKS